MTEKRGSGKGAPKTTGQAGEPARRGGLSRRQVVIGLGGVAAMAAGALALTGLFGAGPASADEIVVYKSPSCGCCGQWARHLRRSGFEVSVNDIDNVSPVKERAGVPVELESCHTAFVAGYVVEGHVPAQDIRRLLAERPDIEGLAVPGMPASAPGMDGPDREPYTVYSFNAAGRPAVYASY